MPALGGIGPTSRDLDRHTRRHADGIRRTSIRCDCRSVTSTSRPARVPTTSSAARDRRVVARRPERGLQSRDRRARRHAIRTGLDQHVGPAGKAHDRHLVAGRRRCRWPAAPAPARARSGVASPMLAETSTATTVTPASGRRHRRSAGYGRAKPIASSSNAATRSASSSRSCSRRRRACSIGTCCRKRIALNGTTGSSRRRNRCSTTGMATAQRAEQKQRRQEAEAAHRACPHRRRPRVARYVSSAWSSGWLVSTTW